MHQSDLPKDLAFKERMEHTYYLNNPLLFGMSASTLESKQNFRVDTS
jgi:hypothetical protein